MNFDDNHIIHLERVDRDYPHLDILRRINEEAFPKEERINLSILFDSNDELLKDKIIFGGVEALDPNAENYKQRVSRIKFHTKNGFHIFDKVDI